MIDVESYSTPQVARLTGASYRQLDYWARTDVLVPSLSVACGSGTQRRYSAEDLRLAFVVAAVARFSLRHDAIRLLVRAVRERNEWSGFAVVDEAGATRFTVVPFLDGAALVVNLASIADAADSAARARNLLVV